MNMRQILRLVIAMILFSLIVIPWVARAQEEEPRKEPFTVQFEKPSDYPDCKYYMTTFIELFEKMPLTVNHGEFSGSASGVVGYDKSPYSEVSCKTGQNKSLTGTNYQQNFQISGTYENGILEGTWSQTVNIIEYPANPGDEDIMTKVTANGTFKSDGPFTGDEIPVTFTGDHSYNYDKWFEGEKLDTVGYGDSIELTVKLKVYTEGVQQPGEAATGEAGGEEGSESLPGIGTIGDIPGPDNFIEGLTGILVPGIIGVLSGLFVGGGSTGLAEPPTGEEPGGPEEPPDEEEAGPGPDPATKHAKKILDIFDKRNEIDKNPELKNLADEARESAFDADGNVIPGKWQDYKEKMRDAIGAHAGEAGTTSVVGETVDGVTSTAADAYDKTAEGLSFIGKSVADGFKGLANGIKNPEYVAIGLNEKFEQWVAGQEQAKQKFGEDFSKALEQKDMEAALKSLYDYEAQTPGGSLLGTMVKIGSEILPVEEIETILDSNASLDEKLWAIPAAASKIAGLLVGTEAAEMKLPGTGTRSFIPSARTAAAAEEAAGAGATKTGAGTVADDTTAAAGKGRGAAAEEAGAGATEKPGPGAKAEAGAEAKAREAQKSAERQAEAARGDAARTQAEKRFNDPTQRPAYEADYKQYMDNAQKKAESVVDTVKDGKAPDVDQAMENMSDPAAMRNLKNAPEEARRSFIETQNKIIEPTNRDVESFLKDKYPGEEIKVESVRTPGKNYDPATSINTDNDVHAIRKVTNQDGSSSWREVPSDEWSQAYHDSFAKNSNFSTEAARERFPEVDWDNMTPQQQTRKWGELHQQEPGDVFGETAGRDFRKGSQDPLRTGPATDESAHAMAKRGEGKLADPEQLGLMEKEKFTKEWNKGTIPHQKEALEQLRKQGEEVEGLIKGYQKQGMKVENLPPQMKNALDIIKDNNLSPLDRAERIKNLGFPGGPAEVADKLGSRLGGLNIARPK